MAPTADGCKHPTWRTDFAANGKLHEFCIACGAERRISHAAESAEAARLLNGLRWIRHVAAMNLLGDSSGPLQTRALTVLAEKLLDGAELADYDSSIGLARGKAQEWASSAEVDLATVEDLQRAAGITPADEPLPGQRDRAEEAPAASSEPDRTIVLDVQLN